MLFQVLSKCPGFFLEFIYIFTDQCFCEYEGYSKHNSMFFSNYFQYHKWYIQYHKVDESFEVD